MRAGSLVHSLSILEQTSKKSVPDLLISGCSGVLFWAVPAGKQTKKSPSSAETSSRRTVPSHPLRDSTSDLGCCQYSGRLFPQSFVGARYIVPTRRFGGGWPPLDPQRRLWVAHSFCAFCRKGGAVFR